MAGSWEVQNQHSVLVGILHTDNTTMAWSLGLRNLIVPNGGILPVAGMPFDHARNTICMKALDAGVDWVFHLDSDVIPPHDAIPRLIAHKQPIISGVYYRRSPPIGHPVMMKPAGQWYDNYPKKGIFEVDTVGAGCLLIHRSVLEKLPPQRPGRHWFDWRVDLAGTPEYQNVPCMSEDFTFTLHAKHHGYKVYVDPEIQCRHIGLAQSTQAGFGPMDCTPIT